MDFRTAYSSALCLLHRCDPYNPSDVLRTYEVEGGARSTDSDADRFSVPRNNYPPTEFVITVPFAFVPFGIAQVLWVLLTLGSYTVAAFLMWDLAADHAPELAGGLVGFLLAYSEQILFYGNLAGFAVAFCMVSAWCFLRNRFLSVGVIALAVSLAVKPHDVALVWIYFFFAGGVFRRWALQTAALMAAFSVTTALWVTHHAPHWIREMQSNIQAFSIHGGGIDVSSAAIDSHGTCLIANLQSLFAVFHDAPRFYNVATYLVFIPMLLAWSVATIRARFTPTLAFLALAVIAPLSMLPIYHRIYDAKIIMLTVPACALLWAEGGRIGRLAMIITAAGCLLTGDLVWGLYFEVLMHLRLLPAVSPSPLLAASINIPLPLILLIVAAFYLSVYIHRAFHPASFEKTAQLEVAATPHS